MTQILDREISLADMAEFEFAIKCSGTSHPTSPYHDNGDAKFWLRTICPDCRDTNTRPVCAKFAETILLYPEIEVFCVKCDWLGVAGEAVTVLGAI